MKCIAAFVCALMLIALANVSSARSIELKGAGFTVTIDDAKGSYTIARQKPAQRWSGSIGGELNRVMQGQGQDELGKFESMSFMDREIERQIHVYVDRSVVVFGWTSDKALAKPPAEFPDFTELPGNQHVLSYSNKTFAVPQFHAEQNTGTPFIFFDDSANTTIVSPAANFMTASLHGDGEKRLSSGFVPELGNLPENFSHRTMMVFDTGINVTYRTWGDAMLALLNAKRPPNDADVGLKYLGYWTDNKATYYYHFDPDKGYAGTLLAAREEWKKLGIPFKYLQLDSWWYKKTSTDADGKQGASKKNSELPEASWNKYGGLLEYTAHEDLFPNGLAPFQKQIGLPLITHNRWVDLKSPYRDNFQISGVGAVDPKWWDMIAQYCQDNGITTYEQDWLDRIYNNSPEFKSTADKGEAFMDEMSRATRERDITMQYCMTLPRHYLQGAKYLNLTSVRVCTDGFNRVRWSNALYVSTLAGALKEWPWVDVFMSHDTPDLLLATLTAGVVGVGDPIGQLDKDNLMLAARPDGVIVKPDLPITPIDQSLIADAQKKKEPLIAATSSSHGDLKTAYVFVYPQASEQSDYHFTAAEVGISGDAWVYDWKNRTGKKLAAGERFNGSFGDNATTMASDPSWAYYIVAPITKSGLGVLGDEGKFASMGTGRIENIRESADGMIVAVAFAPDEKSVVLHGFDSAGKHFSRIVESNGSASVSIELKAKQ